MGPEAESDDHGEPSSVTEFRRTSACLIPPDAEEAFRDAMGYPEDSPNHAQMMAAGWLKVLEKNPRHPEATKEYDRWMGLIWGHPRKEN